MHNKTGAPDNAGNSNTGKKITCAKEQKCASEEWIQKIIKTMPEDLHFLRLEELFKTMGSQTRLKIIYSLMEARELCVEHLAEATGMSISAVSHQLRILRQLRLVKTRKLGQSVYYSLDDVHVALLYETAQTHVLEEGGQK